MQATLIGVTRLSGTGKESKKKYDMPRALMLMPIQTFENDITKREGYGYESIEVDLSPDALHLFDQQKFPLTSSFSTVQEVRGGKLTTIITGLMQKSA